MLGKVKQAPKSMMELLQRLENTVVVSQNLTFEKSSTLKTVISTLQISVMLDYSKDCFRRICEGIEINKRSCNI